MRTPFPRFGAALLAAAAGLLIPLRRADAQTCFSCGGGGGDTNPPVVSISPGTQATGNTVSVTVTWQDPGGSLVAASRSIKLNGTAVTGSFTYTGTSTSATSTGTLSLAPGANTVTATINDAAGNQGSGTVTYTAPLRLYGIPNVTPDGGTQSRTANAAATEVFTVTNVDSDTQSVSFSATCTGSVSGTCAPGTSSLRMAPGDTATVPVAYRATAAGSARVMLKAWFTAIPAQRDSGYVDASVSAASGANGFVGDSAGLGRIERGDCLTIGVPSGAAYECGDLRLAHALPAVRLLNHVSAPVLVYNSQHAAPTAIVSVDYAPPAGAVPTTVRLNVCTQSTINPGVSICSPTDFTGWTPGVTRRISAAVSLQGAGTGVARRQVMVTSLYADGTSQSTPQRNEDIVVVDRSATPFGAGWWVAGVEQLVFLDDGSRLWVGGDGSAHVYRPVASSGPWVADGYERPDTLTYDGATSEYVRTLPGRAEVRFDGLGNHVRTVNRLGHVTRMFWTGHQLDSIQVAHPSGTTSGFTYSFQYTGGKLARVVSPDAGTARVTTVAITSGRVDTITDPDGAVARFGYSDATGRVTSRTDPRKYRSDFRYDAGSRLSAAKAWMDTLAVGDSVVARFTAAESRGLPGTTGPADTSTVYTLYDGPRTDTLDYVRFSLNRWGAPTRIVNPRGYVTTIVRGDARWPGLATSVVYPNGREVTSTYDARGNTESVTDWSRSRGGSYATTTYRWDPTWDAVTRSTAPEGEVSLRHYDAYGRLDWMQAGQDTARRVSFVYNSNSSTTAPGLVQQVKSPPRSPQPRVESYDYDARGNLSLRVSPLQIRTEYLNDALGRVRRVKTPIDSMRVRVDTMDYDLMGRDTVQISQGPATSGRFPVSTSYSYTTPAQTLRVGKRYDAAGNLRTVTRTGSDTQFGAMVTTTDYDALGRVVAQTEPDNTVTRTSYFPAGDSVEVLTRRGHRIGMKYDVLGELIRRRTPSIHADDEWSPGAGWSFPRYTNGFDVTGDLTTFTYDTTGNLRTARNRDAGVTRVWNRDGTLAQDSLWIRSYAGTDTTSHRYGLRYGYDLNGRRIWMKHPQTLAPLVSGAVRDSTAYEYDALGQLAAVVDPLGNRFTYRYDAAGRVDSLSAPGGVYQRRFWDDEDRMTARRDMATLYVGAADGPANATLHDDALTFNAGGQTNYVTETQNIAGSTSFNWWHAYTGLGALARAGSRNAFAVTTYKEEAYLPDALGNMNLSWRQAGLTSGVDSVSTVIEYDYDGMGRLHQSWHPGTGFVGDVSVETELNGYDAAGDRTHMTSNGNTAGGPVASALASYYAADGQLVAVERRSCAQDSGGNCTANPVPLRLMSVFEEYRYDPLGRRVLVRTRADTACTSPCESAIRRTVWDGDHVLWEIRMPGGDADAARLEQDTLPAYTSTRSFGRVLYTNGAELDHPLDIIRIGYSQSWPGPVAIMPLYNWRGIADGGHFSGKMKQCVNASVDSTCVQISWPAANVNPFMAPYADYAQSAWIGEVPQQQRDATGLIYMRNRYYDPNSGQFTQQDPAGLAGGANLYGFANGDPVTYGDPYGLAADGDGGCCGYAAAKVGPPPPQLPRLHITWHDVREFINHHGVDVIMAVIPIGLERDGGNMIARLAGRELEPQGTLVIGKMAALERGVAADEYTLLPQMTENLGSPRANWARNDGLLRRAMGRGDPIRDASVDVHGRLLDETGFLRAERNVLRNHGWTYDPASHYWQPPGAR